MPRIFEQSGRLTDVPTPREAGGTALVCVATRGIELDAGVEVGGGGDVFAGADVGVEGGGDVFAGDGVGVDGGGDVSAGAGVGADGGEDVFG
jgi:hypothetical protein